MVLRQIQDLLSGIYDLPLHYNVYDFLFTERERLPEAVRDSGTDEQVLVRDQAGGAAVGLFLDARVLERLSQANPLEALQCGQSGRLLDRARGRQPLHVSGLECGPRSRGVAARAGAAGARSTSTSRAGGCCASRTRRAFPRSCIGCCSSAPRSMRSSPPAASRSIARPIATRRALPSARAAALSPRLGAPGGTGGVAPLLSLEPRAQSEPHQAAQLSSERPRLRAS